MIDEKRFGAFIEVYFIEKTVTFRKILQVTKILSNKTGEIAFDVAIIPQKLSV